MRIHEVLRRKGHEVVTVAPETHVRQLIAVLAEHRIGAAVVSTDGSTVEGIVSERDVVIAVAERGAAALSEPVSQIATTDVQTSGPDAQIQDLMHVMTEHRVRHVPIVVEGELRGIVSIGDVVKSRILELEVERSTLNDYISTAR